VLIHIPEPRRHLVRTYGAYSSVARAHRRAEGQPCVQDGAEEFPPASPERRALRRLWAALISRIDEVDPQVCPRCGGTMRIIAFMTEPRVIGKTLKHLAATGVDARSRPGADPSS